MWKYNYTDELYHYGVLGMKWGRRKSRSRIGKPMLRTRKPKIDKRSEDSKNVAQIRKKKVNQMTNQELKEVNKRLELETKYNELANKKITGQRAVSAIIATGLTIGTIETAARNYKKAADFVIDKLGKRVVR